MKWVRIYIAIVLFTSMLFGVVEYFFSYPFVSTLFVVSPALLAFAVSCLDPYRTLRDLGWKPNFRYWLIITFSIGLVVLVLLAVAWLSGHTEVNEKTVRKFFAWSMISSLILGIVLNTGEEAGWRGYMFPSLVREKGWWKAVVLTSFIWWLWHVPMMAVLQVKMFGHIQYSTQLIHFLSLIPPTIIFGIWMKGSGSFWAIGFAHQLINFVNKWFLGLEHSEKVPMFFANKDHLRIYSTENGILGVAAMGALAIGLYMYARKKRPDLLRS